jgi:glycine/D-amino acid oxidase-like deaminating enzyme
MKTLGEAEVVVVGAGAVGTSVAYHLAKRGRRVTVVDRGGIGAGTSAATFALIWVHSKEPVHYMELSLRSAKMFPSLVHELNADVHFDQPGGITLCMSDDDVAKGHAMVARQSASPLFGGRVIDAAETHRLQPGLSREVVGAVYSPDDGHIDSIRYVTALARAARRLGVEFLTYTEVTGIERADRAVRGVLTNHGRIAAAHVVNAAGPHAASIAKMVGIDLAVHPVRGQVLVTLPMPRTLRMPMSGVRQNPTGHFFLGFTREDAGYDSRVTTAGIRSIVRSAVRRVPIVGEARLLRAFAGIRSMPADGLPCLGPVPGVPGFYVAVSHSGITLSPLHGRVITDLICDGRTEIPIAPYDPLRPQPAAAVT